MEQLRAIELDIRDPSSPEFRPSLPLKHYHHHKLFVYHTTTSGVAGLTKAFKLHTNSREVSQTLQHV